jgi:hypothetical protein
MCNHKLCSCAVGYFDCACNRNRCARTVAANCENFIVSSFCIHVLFLPCSSHFPAMNEDDRPTKLRKLNAFRRQLPHVTASALGAILAAVATHGLPDLHTRDDLRQARDLQAAAVTPYGPILQTVEVQSKDDTPKQLTIAHPFALLWTAVSECLPFMELFKEQLRQKPSTPEEPWRIILYSDEVTPGNVMSPNNKRKFHAIYWSFLELGAHALSREECWFCTATAYSTFINDLHAGLSQAFAAVIKVFFDSSGFDFSLGGINLPFSGGDIRLFAKLGVVIQDGGAHKSVWSSRGDAASKFCLLCKNLFTKSSRMVDEDGRHMLVCDALTLDSLVPATDADLRRNARFLEKQASCMSADDFTALQQSLGMTHHKKAILLDRSLDNILKPTEVYLHDWMHCLFVDGVVNLVIYLLFEEFIMHGTKNIYETFSEYIGNWQWPSRLHWEGLSEIFSSSRKDKHRSARHIKCQASDLLSLVGVLALFVQKVLLKLHKCEAACHAFLALADIVDIIMSSSRNEVSPALLLSRCYRFLDLFVKAFGSESQIPKMHWLLHLSEALMKFGILVNCFVLERKHRIGKRFATEFSNISRDASKSLLSEVVSQNLGMLTRPHALDFKVGLIAGRDAPTKVHTAILKALDAEADTYRVQIAIESRFSKYGTCCKGDVVLVKEGNSFRAGKVLLHAAVEGEAISIVTCWALVKHECNLGYAVWRPSSTQELILTADIADTVVYSELPDGTVGTLLPVDYR